MNDSNDWTPHGFTRRVHAMKLVVHQLKGDACRWEVKGELFQAAGFCNNLGIAQRRASDAADAIDKLESLVADGEPWGNRVPNPGRPQGYVHQRDNLSQQDGVTSPLGDALEVFEYEMGVAINEARDGESQGALIRTRNIIRRRIRDRIRDASVKEGET